jgi:ABC-2 type transport system permease protein
MLKWMGFMLGSGIDAHWFISNVIARGLLGLIPGAWLTMAKVDPATLLGGQQTVAIGSLFQQSWMTLADPSVWIGAVVGAAMIYGAIRLRRWRDEG